MKIHIICGPFFPQLHPRAFRCTELAKEFIRMGHTVNVTTATTIDDVDYDSLVKEIGIAKMHRLSIIHRKSKGDSSMTKGEKHPILFKIRYSITEYLFAGRTILYAYSIAKKLHIDDDTDLIISVSTPFSVILGTSYYLRKHPNLSATIVADSGDPFYYSAQDKRGPWFKYIEKRAYKNFHYLTIPVVSAVPCYDKLIKKDYIRIIPQGFNMENVNLATYKPNKPTKFAYSGVFYMNIRNPEFLFKYLDQSHADFEFNLFLRYQEPAFVKMLDKYPNLKAKTKITESLDRESLLIELSKMDFLLNIGNVSNTQIPSKLIDYGIAGRPIYNCSQDNFDTKLLDRYLSMDFSGYMPLDISAYNIKNVAHQFIELTKAPKRDLK